ncbi:MAG: sulfur carrier protein ThiS [Giesbergeria sp.]|nr:sulfur carrier protein ThiS [Giesbergeria sp.]
MHITINQTPHALPDGATLLDALAALGARPPFAVAVNTAFVPSAEHARHLLQDGDSVEVISPVTGG